MQGIFSHNSRRSRRTGTLGTGSSWHRTSAEEQIRARSANGERCRSKAHGSGRCRFPDRSACADGCRWGRSPELNAGRCGRTPLRLQQSVTEPTVTGFAHKPSFPPPTAGGPVGVPGASVLRGRHWGDWSRVRQLRLSTANHSLLDSTDEPSTSKMLFPCLVEVFITVAIPTPNEKFEEKFANFFSTSGCY